MDCFVELSKELAYSIQLADQLDVQKLENNRNQEIAHKLKTILLNQLKPCLKTTQSELNGNQELLDNLVQERDLLMARMVMQADKKTEGDKENNQRRQNQRRGRNNNNRAENRSNEHSPDFNSFLWKECDSLRIQLDKIIQRCYSKQEANQTNKLIQMNALCLFILEYIKRNSVTMKQKFDKFIERAQQRGFHGVSGHQAYGSFGNGDSSSRLPSSGQRAAFMAEVQAVMEKDGKRLTSLLNCYEFKQNFKLYEQNLDLKKQNENLKKKLDGLNQRVDGLLRRFRQLGKRSVHGSGLKNRGRASKSRSQASRLGEGTVGLSKTENETPRLPDGGNRKRLMFGSLDDGVEGRSDAGVDPNKNSTFDLRTRSENQGVVLRSRAKTDEKIRAYRKPVSRVPFIMKTFDESSHLRNPILHQQQQLQQNPQIVSQTANQRAGDTTTTATISATQNQNKQNQHQQPQNHASQTSFTYTQNSNTQPTVTGPGFQNHPTQATRVTQHHQSTLISEGERDKDTLIFYLKGKISSMEDELRRIYDEYNTLTELCQSQMGDTIKNYFKEKIDKRFSLEDSVERKESSPGPSAVGDGQGNLKIKIEEAQEDEDSFRGSSEAVKAFRESGLMSRASSSDFAGGAAAKLLISSLQYEVGYLKKCVKWKDQERSFLEKRLKQFEQGLMMNESIDDLITKIEGFFNYMTIFDENRKIMMQALESSYDHLVSDSKSLKLKGALFEKKEKLKSEVEEILRKYKQEKDGLESPGEANEGSKGFLLKFGDGILNQLRDHTNSFKDEAYKCKALIVKVEQFYVEMKKIGMQEFVSSSSPATS